MDQNETKCNSKHEREEERSAEDKSARTRVRIFVSIWLQ